MIGSFWSNQGQRSSVPQHREQGILHCALYPLQDGDVLDLRREDREFS